LAVPVAAWNSEIAAPLAEASITNLSMASLVLVGEAGKAAMAHRR